MVTTKERGNGNVFPLVRSCVEYQNIDVVFPMILRNTICFYEIMEIGRLFSSTATNVNSPLTAFSRCS